MSLLAKFSATGRMER